MNLLAGVGRRSWVNDDGNLFTLHSVIYNLTERSIYFVGNEHYGDPDYIYRYNFD